MNYTQNYQLNQWEALDKVQRTDFNADNAKIDAAMKAVDQKVDLLSTQAEQKIEAETAARVSALASLEERTVWQLIKTETVGTAGQYYMCPLSGIRWSDWREVMVVFQINMGENVYQVRPYGGSYDSFIAASRYPMVMLLYPARLSSMPMLGISLGTSPMTFNTGTSYSSINAFQLSASTGSALPSSGRISFYGRK